MAHRAPISPRESLEGLAYFPRMLDKIRLHAAGGLDTEYHEKLGKGFDDECCIFLGVGYEEVVGFVTGGASDEEVFEELLNRGRRPSPYEIEVWSAYLSKRGWRDSVSEILVQRKADLGLSGRDDVQTFFDFIDADEGRDLSSS